MAVFSPEDEHHGAYVQLTNAFRVRAVLSALRELDEGMIEAGFGACAAGWPDEECRDVLPEIWTAMIDKILRQQG